MILRNIVLFLLISSACGGSLYAFDNDEILQDDKDISSQGLYDKNDRVEILTKQNFKDRIYEKHQAWVVEFYNSWCGFCKRFAPEYKNFAEDVSRWRHIVRVGAIDCADDDNNYICRDFEIMAYPTLRYFHEYYTEAPKAIGEQIKKGADAEELRTDLTALLQTEQSKGNGINWPDLKLHTFSNLDEARIGLGGNDKYLFLIFESENSTIGGEVILDLSTVPVVKIKRVLITSGLAKNEGVVSNLTLLVSEENLSATVLTLTKEPTRVEIRKTIVYYLSSKNVALPHNIVADNNYFAKPKDISKEVETQSHVPEDMVYMSDLEGALKYSLKHEITKYKTLSGEPLDVFKSYLHILKKYFPFSSNGEKFIKDLSNRVSRYESWTGDDLLHIINQLEQEYAPVFWTSGEWVGCRGSSSKYRGYTCSLWILFHTLSVRADLDRDPGGFKVLKTVQGYVKNFFGCSDCKDHFLGLAAKNKLSEVTKTDKAVMWLWLAHNEVNLRLAGDSTEDPKHPKVQFPAAVNCPACRNYDGTWDLKEVLHYLRKIFSPDKIHIRANVHSRSAASSSLSNLDMGLMGLLYISSFIILLLVIKLFLAKRFYRKKVYVHDTWGKV